MSRIKAKEIYLGLGFIISYYKNSMPAVLSIGIAYFYG